MRNTGFLLLALWAVVCTQSAADDCKSALGQHHVILTIPGDNAGHCSGALLSKDWVITAAQCNEVDLEVILGQSAQKTGERRKIQQKIVFKDSQGSHDLMLLKVDGKASDKFPMARLPDRNTCKPPAAKTAVQFFGWTGATFHFKDNTTHPQQLQCGTVSIAECGSMSRYGDDPDEEMKAYVYQTLLCASHPTDACDLFSGAALIHSGVLHGVLVNSDIYCKASLEFMDLCHKEYRKWIFDTAGL